MEKRRTHVLDTSDIQRWKRQRPDSGQSGSHRRVWCERQNKGSDADSTGSGVSQLGVRDGIATCPVRRFNLRQAMATIKVILVRGCGERLALVRVPQGHLDLLLDVEADTALEAVRYHFQERWDAKVHVLRWLFPEDFVRLRSRQQTPFLVLWLETVGTIPVDGVEDRAGTRFEDRGINTLEPFLTTAASLCPAEPWSLPSWFPDVSSWIRTHFPQTRQIAQVRVCPNGAVVRIECVDGAYYLKRQSAPLAYESALLTILNQRVPGTCPSILLLHPDVYTHVTKAITGSPIEKCGPISWEVALRDVAKIQVESINLVSEFCGAGIPHHCFSSLNNRLEKILDELIVLQDGSPNKLNPGELRKIAKLGHAAAADFDVLRRCDLPETLIHGDLNQSNAFRNEAGGTVLIDWALSRVTHPFFVLGSALFAPYDSGRREQREYRNLCTAYLEPWRDFASTSRLEAGLDAASRLFWIDSTIAVTSLCQPGHVRNLVNVPRFLRAVLRAYGLHGC